MGLLKGQEETLIDGDYQVIKTSLFDGMYKSYRFQHEQPVMTVYEMLYVCNMNIDDVEFLVDNGYLIELAQSIVILMSSGDITARFLTCQTLRYVRTLSENIIITMVMICFTR